jgi:hypothetical protein
MKTQRKSILTLSLAGLGALGAIASVSADTLPVATATNQTTISTKGRRHHNEADMTAVKLAVSNGDYQAFLTATQNLMSSRPAGAPAMPTITQTQFNAIVAAEKLRTSGNSAGAKTLLDNAGIQIPGGAHGVQNGGKEFANLTDAQKTAMSQAKSLFEAGKLTEAKSVLSAVGIAMPVRAHKGDHNDAQRKAFESSLTDAQKAALKQAHDLMKSGKKDEADALIKSAGITLPSHQIKTPTAN